MSSNTAASSSTYNFAPGDWAWGATDPSKNWEVKLNSPCLGYHPAADSNEDNVLLLLDQSYDDHRDVVPLPGKMEYPSFSEVGRLPTEETWLLNNPFRSTLRSSRPPKMAISTRFASTI